MTEISTPIEYRPIVIGYSTDKSLISIEKKVRADAIALYYFYYRTAVWQKTDKVWCTEPYALKGLGISKSRFREAKRALKDKGLILQLKPRDEDGAFAKPYIQVCYHTTGRPDTGRPVSRRAVNWAPSAYNNKVNAYNNKKNINTSAHQASPSAAPDSLSCSVEHNSHGSGSRRTASPSPSTKKSAAVGCKAIADTEYTSAFEEFWSLYPRKKGKKNAYKAWKKLNVDPPLLAVILKAVRDQKQPGGPLAEDPDSGYKYVKYPQGWLSGGHWEDEVEIGPEPTNAFETHEATEEELRERGLW